MMRRVPWQLVGTSCAVAACFDPHATTGVPCGGQGACPTGQLCDPATRTCQPSAGSADGNTSGDGSGATDCWAAWLGGTIAFAPPARIAELVNAAKQEHPALSGDDLTLYFDREVAGRARDFYAATRATRGAPWTNPTAESLSGHQVLYAGQLMNLPN